MAHPRKIYTLHVIASFVILFMLIGALFVFRGFILDMITNPPLFLIDDLSASEVNSQIVFLTLTIIIVLVSYIFYLLLTYNSRFELIIGEETKSLAFSKEQFKKLYESAPVPYVLLDKDGNIHEPNKATLRFFGAFAEDIEGKNLFSYISDTSKNNSEDLLKYYRSKISIDRRDAEMITKNGHIRSVLLSIFDMKGPRSINSAGLAVMVDITEQKLIEKTKTEFLSLASHQLKSPLATTKWYTESLLSGDMGILSEKQKEFVNVLHIANQNMIELVDVLLNISRIEMGTIVADKVSVNIKELVESVIEEFSLQISNKQIKIENNYNNLFDNENVDPKLLRIVIQNLISNAIKYTPTGGTVKVDFNQSSRENKIIITDTGVGIPQDQQDRIFSKLFRADNVKKLNGSQGTGLGLYLVKSLMVSMGGDIRFSSEENKGSVFTIIF